MEKTFKEYNSLTQPEIDELWNKAIFIFDTNVLLNFYRYSDETAQKFIETIEKLNERVWLPYQVGLEFNKNRLSVISDQKKSYVEFDKKLNNLIEDVENKSRNPFLSESLLSKLISIREKIKIEVDNKISHYDDCINSNDKLFPKINSIFQGKVGEAYKDEELKKIYSEGDKRYKDKIPPGFKDNGKPENEKFGDLIIWKQIISKAKNDEVDLIFILDDRKEDWWLEHQGKTISPRPELLKEFRNETNKICHFYKPFQFLEFSNQYLKSQISTEIIEEVKNYNPKHNLEKNDEYVIIEILLSGKESEINLFISELKTAGYKILSEPSSNDFYKLAIILPNIPDLERRFNDKYLLNLKKYSLELIKKTIK